MTEPQGDDGTIDARLQKVHGHGVSQAVNGDTLLTSTKGRPWTAVSRCLFSRYCTPWTLRRSPLALGNNTSSITALRLSQPGFQYGERGFGDGRTAFLATFADHAHVSAGSEDEILAFEPGHLGQAQTRLNGHQEKGVIAPAGPGALIRSGKQGIDFGTREKLDQVRVKRLLGMASTRWICAECVGASKAA